MNCTRGFFISISLFMLMVSTSTEITDDGNSLQKSLVEVEKELLTLKAKIAEQDAKIADQNVRIAEQNTKTLQIENTLKQKIFDQNDEIRRLRFKSLESDVQTKSNLADQNVEIQKQNLKYCQLENKINKIGGKCHGITMDHELESGTNNTETKYQNMDENVHKRDIDHLQESVERNTLQLQKLNSSNFRAQEKILQLEDKFEDSSHIAFLARVATATRISGSSAIHFDQVVINEGNAYSAHTGCFTAPSAGLYLFSWTLISRSSQAIHSELHKNGVIVARQYASTSHWDMATSIAVVILTEGDKLQVKHDPNHESGGTDITPGDYNTFLGYRIK